MAWMTSKPKLKHVSEQTIVITGASSGIGLATARLAARRGANVVLAARDEEDLRRITNEIRGRGGRSTYIVADVADPAAVDRIAEEAIRQFGGFDTWVNNAAVAIYGKLTEVPLDEKKRLFETNFWGVVNGCRTAVKHLRDRGGALINIGSVVSDRALPLMGIYSASKHAVQGYTDALRMELEHDGLPISVTLVKPSSINTPFADKARNYMDAAPDYLPPVYAPEVVAETILRCAEKRIREITVGAGGRVMAVMGMVAPSLTDAVMERTAFEGQKDRGRPAERQDAFYSTKSGQGEAGSHRGPVLQSSAYTRAMLSDVTRALPFIAAGVVLAAGARKMRGPHAA